MALSGWKWTRSGSTPCRLFFGQFQHLVNYTILDRFKCAHVVVALRVVLDTIHRLPGMFVDDFVQYVARVQDFTSMDIDIGGLPANPP